MVDLSEDAQPHATGCDLVSEGWLGRLVLSGFVRPMWPVAERCVWVGRWTPEWAYFLW